MTYKAIKDVVNEFATKVKQHEQKQVSINDIDIIICDGYLILRCEKDTFDNVYSQDVNVIDDTLTPLYFNIY